MKQNFLAIAILLIVSTSASADILRPDFGPRCKRIYTNLPAACDARLQDCLNQINIPIFYEPEFIQDLMFCYEEDAFCRDSFTEECEIDPNVTPPPPEEPPPGWDSPSTPEVTPIVPLPVPTTSSYTYPTPYPQVATTGYPVTSTMGYPYYH